MVLYLALAIGDLYTLPLSCGSDFTLCRSVVENQDFGKVEFRNDTGGNVHVVVGKKSFDQQKLVENIQAFMDTIKKMRPATTKGAYIKLISLSTTMSPGVAVNVSEF